MKILLIIIYCLVFVNSACAEPEKEQYTAVIKNQTNISDENNQKNETLYGATVKKSVSLKYLISPGDTLSFSVYDEPDLTQNSITVRPDGYATFEPIGEVNVASLDIDTLTKIIEKKMEYYVRNPHVSINIKSFNPVSVYIHGAVQKPGLYQQAINTQQAATDSKNPLARTNMNITNIIANAGGITYDADLANVEITNRVKNRKFKVDLWKLVYEGDTTQDVTLCSEDVIFIPRLKTVPPADDNFKTLVKSSIYPDTFLVRIIGEVNIPGIYDINTKSPYLDSAIAIAKGYKPDANKKHILVYRKTLNNNVSRIIVNTKEVNFVLRPNDMIFVKSSLAGKVVHAAEKLTKIITPSNMAASTYNNWAEVFNPARRYEYLNK